MNLEALRRDLGHLADRDVLVYGSQATGDATFRSDIDVAVVTREAERGRNLHTWRDLLGQAPDRYDIRIFELLPLPVQVEVIQRGIVLFGDPTDLSEYFYRFRRRWKDVGHRVDNRASVAQLVAARRRQTP